MTVSDQSILIAFLLSVILGVIHYLGDGLKIPQDPKRYRIISLAAGISIGYLFLDLFPRTFAAAERLQSRVFLFLLLGFSIVHLVEKYVYQHADKRNLEKELKAVHLTTFFFYYLFIGCVMTELTRQETYQGLLFLFPVALHAGLSSASLSEIHGQLKHRQIERILLALAAPLGVVLAVLINIPPHIYNIMISGISGILLYVFVKEFLPEKRLGQPIFFVMGLIIFYALMQLFYIIIH